MGTSGRKTSGIGCVVLVLALGAPLLAARDARADSENGAPTPNGRSVTLLGEQPPVLVGGNSIAPITTLKGADRTIGYFHSTHLDSDGAVQPGPGPVVLDFVNHVLSRTDIWNYDFGNDGTITMDATVWFAPVPVPGPGPGSIPGALVYGVATISGGTGKYAHVQGYVELHCLSSSYCINYWVLSD